MTKTNAKKKLLMPILGMICSSIGIIISSLYLLFTLTDGKFKIWSATPLVFFIFLTFDCINTFHQRKYPAPKYTGPEPDNIPIVSNQPLHIKNTATLVALTSGQHNSEPYLQIICDLSSNHTIPQNQLHKIYNIVTNEEQHDATNYYIDAINTNLNQNNFQIYFYTDNLPPIAKQAQQTASALRYALSHTAQFFKDSAINPDNVTFYILAPDNNTKDYLQKHIADSFNIHKS